MKKRVALKVFKRTLKAISPIGDFEDNPSYNIKTISKAIRKFNKLKRRIKTSDKQRTATECTCYQ